MNIKYLVSMILVLASTLPVKAFEHHMLKEMLEQKETLGRTIDFCKKLSDSDALWAQGDVTSSIIKQLSSFYLMSVHLGQLFFKGQPDLSVDKPCSLLVPNTQITTKRLRQKKVLVCAPHPDDDIIGCGGSIAKHKKNGNEVSIVYMTSGDAGSLKYTKQELAQIREQEAQAGAQIIGADATYFLRNSDGYLTYNKKNLITMINLIRKIKPDIVYLPHKKDAHKDHMVTYEIVWEAIKRSSVVCLQGCIGNSWTVEKVLCYEVWTPLSEVTYIEDISAFMPQKLKALRQHVSQIQDVKYDAAVEGLNRYRGAMTGVGKYCECFQLLKIGMIHVI